MRSHEVSVNATTIGVNSFNNSAFGVVNGAYSAITGAYDGGGFRSNASQNFGATITGSLNSIESKTASSNYSGVGNNIVGVANREFNANGALIFGAGNEITNSVTTVSAPTSSGNSPKALQQTLMGVIKEAEGGGSTMAMGGGNKADYTQKTQITGVNNTVTGTAVNVASVLTGATSLYSESPTVSSLRTLIFRRTQPSRRPSSQTSASAFASSKI